MADDARRTAARRTPRSTLPLGIAITAMTLTVAAVLCVRAQPPAGSTPAAAQVARDAQLDHRFTTEVRPILTQYCAACHANGKKKGDVSLDRFTSAKAVRTERKFWRHIADTLDQRAMPPEDKPQPPDAQLKTVLAWVDDALNQDDCTGPRDPGRVAPRRLNRNEYNNTIRDLVGIDVKPAADFPVDDTGYGFDNIADVLSMSTLLAEKYLAAADDVFDRAITDTRVPQPKIVKIPATQMKAEVGSPAIGTAWSVSNNGQIVARHEFPHDGQYEIRVVAWQEPFGDQPARMTLRLDGKDAQTVDVTALLDKPGVYKLRRAFTAGGHKVAAAYINNFVDMKNPDPKKRGDRNLVVARVEIEGPFDAKAPPPSDSHKRLFFVTPGPALTDDAAARQTVACFASRAFRRPATADEVDRLLKLYAAAKADGERFDSAVRVALSAVLVSPNFLFRIEHDPKDAPGLVHPVTEHELASRLSYFLWSSTPDDELLAAADKGQLRATLSAQVARLLADPKSAEFVRNFVGQWLELRNLDSHSVDAQKFPEFDEKLRAAMKRETELFFENVITEDRSVLELLDANYTFVNARLAKHYGIKGVRGDEFQKIPLAGTRRGGVMTMASVLTLTAMPTRTSPVKRGLFVLENILGTPPPPPPPTVPPLPDRAKDQASASLRDRLAKHRADPTCAVCHQRMDGLGFALENFGPLGVWRDKEGAFPIDSSGELPGGRKIDGPTGLRELLAARKHDFVRCLSEKMLTYALGRGMEDEDHCTIKDIVQAVEKNDHRFSALVGAIVQSDAFQKRRSKRADE